MAIGNKMIIPEDIVCKLVELPVEEVAERLGISIENHKSLCFMHNDHTPSMKYSVKQNIFYCFVCGKGGGPIRLVMEHEGWTFQESCVWLGREFNIWLPEGKRYEKPIKKTIRSVFLPNKVEADSVFDVEITSWLIENAKLSEIAKCFLFEQRHFKDAIIKQLNIKSITYPKQVVTKLISQFGEKRCLKSGLLRKGEYGLYFYFFTPCLLFPYYEQDGTLVGLQSRYLGDKENAPRFQFMSSQKTRVFNLPVLNNLKRGDRLYISEGITDCLALLCSGKEAVAIPSATILPIEDLVSLNNYDLHMYPDQDEAGQKAFIELRRFFVNLYSTIKEDKLPKDVKDYCDYYVQTQIADGQE